MYPGWTYGFNIALAALTIMIGIGGIVLGLGYATNNRKLKEFGFDELNQSVINGLLIGGMLALFLPSGAITSLINSITLSNATVQCPQYLSSNSAICFAEGYLTGNGYTLNGVFHPSILSQSTTLIVGLLSLNTVLGLLASLDINLLAVSFSLSQAIAPIISQVQLLIKTLTTISISVLVQSSILSAIAASATTVILPAGIILRTFYPTRKMGGFLIGSSIGLYVVFPLTYLMNASIVADYSSNLSNSTMTTLSNSASGLNSYMTGALSVKSPNNSLLSGVEGYLSSISGQVSQFMTSMINYVSYFIIAAFILPAFSLAVTFVSIREFSELLGSEINFNIFNLV